MVDLYVVSRLLSVHVLRHTLLLCHYTVYIAVRPAVSGFVSLSAANREYTGGLKDRVLKPARKLSLVVIFVPSESARPDQMYIFIVVY